MGSCNSLKGPSYHFRNVSFSLFFSKDPESDPCFLFACEAAAFYLVVHILLTMTCKSPRLKSGQYGW